MNKEDSEFEIRIKSLKELDGLLRTVGPESITSIIDDDGVEYELVTQNPMAKKREWRIRKGREAI